MTTKAVSRVTRFIWWMQTECCVAANAQTKPVDFICALAKFLCILRLTISREISCSIGVCVCAWQKCYSDFELQGVSETVLKSKTYQTISSRLQVGTSPLTSDGHNHMVYIPVLILITVLNLLYSVVRFNCVKKIWFKLHKFDRLQTGINMMEGRP